MLGRGDFGYIWKSYHDFSGLLENGSGNSYKTPRLYYMAILCSDVQTCRSHDSVSTLRQFETPKYNSKQSFPPTSHFNIIQTCSCLSFTAVTACKTGVFALHPHILSPIRESSRGLQLLIEPLILTRVSQCIGSTSLILWVLCYMVTDINFLYDI